jgi:hypothetical protein
MYRYRPSGQEQSVTSPEPDPHARPDGADDTTVEAVGKLSEALEYLERARGALYEMHQLIGRGDLLVEEAADGLAEAGHEELAERLSEDLVGRNVLDGRWTFQIVEEFERVYYEPFRDLEREVRDQLMAGRRHVHEAEMKENRRTQGRRRHERRPPAHDSVTER